ncbi:DUF4168 domain-containing protein [Brevundimonas sp.]|uniref:DUF4168 domain-containing protein n=1 Tax=Brevundimonas sp. TaxID=1871086 RepID=UPI003BAAEC5F
MRLNLIAAVSTLALASVALPAFAQDADTQDAAVEATVEAEAAPAAAAAATMAAPADAYSDAQLTSFNTAMVKVREVSAAVQGGTPTAEQQAEMAAAIEGSGLTVEQFNGISGSVSSDPVLQARLAVINAPAPSAEAASVTDAELDQFSAAMVKMRQIAPAAGATPTAEQQAEMAATVEGSGLAVERFNAIATAVSQDANLQARVALADARRGV